jgi:hypothetical protein
LTSDKYSSSPVRELNFCWFIMDDWWVTYLWQTVWQFWWGHLPWATFDEVTSNETNSIVISSFIYLWKTLKCFWPIFEYFWWPKIFFHFLHPGIWCCDSFL